MPDGRQMEDRVRDAHLEHLCLGGIGLTVTSVHPAGLSPQDATSAAPAAGEGNAARTAGEACGRCEQPMAPGQEVRRRADGIWVHQNCPPLTVRTPRPEPVSGVR